MTAAGWPGHSSRVFAFHRGLRRQPGLGRSHLHPADAVPVLRVRAPVAPATPAHPGPVRAAPNRRRPVAVPRRLQPCGRCPARRLRAAARPSLAWAVWRELNSGSPISLTAGITTAAFTTDVAGGTGDP